jgi:hypothetical protein
VAKSMHSYLIGVSGGLLEDENEIGKGDSRPFVRVRRGKDGAGGVSSVRTVYTIILHTHHAWRLPGQYILSRSVWGKRS